MAKKSLYIFLCSLLGVMLFLVLDRVAVFLFLYLITAGFVSVSFNYLQFAFYDYFILTLVLMLGGWYGIWLGLGWFNRVYEEKSHGGYVDYLVKNCWPKKTLDNQDSEIAAVKRSLESSLWDIEELVGVEAIENLAVSPAPKVRKVVRKTMPKKVGKKSASK